MNPIWLLPVLIVGPAVAFRVGSSVADWRARREMARFLRAYPQWR